MRPLRWFSEGIYFASAFIALTATVGCDEDSGDTAGPLGPSANNANSSGTGAMSSSATTGAGGMGGMGPGSGGMVGNYPPGPYGNMEGETLPLLDWEGYENPAADAVASNQPWVDSGTDHVHIAATTHALIHLTGVF